MSMSTGLAVTDFGTLDQIVNATAQVKQNINQLSAETDSGYLSSNYAGLGEAAAPALNLSAEISQTTQLQANTQNAATIQQAAQTALGQIESVASTFVSQAINLEGATGSVSTAAAAAQGAMQQVASLLNTQVGGVYVFAGQDSATPPIPNPSTLTQSAFFAAIQSAVAGLTTNGAAATQAAALAAATSAANSPFAASLTASGAQSEVDLGGGVRVALAPLANTNSNAVSTGVGTTSTGSYTQDILYGLATIASLTPSQAADVNFVPLVQGAVTTLSGAVTAINVDIGVLGDRQDQVNGAHTELGDTATTLQSQLSNLQDADLTQVATQLSQAQTQLQASYQVLASLGTLTLARFLPA
jgi:flagellar hook-associated protein 3 FlgL